MDYHMYKIEINPYHQTLIPILESQKFHLINWFHENDLVYSIFYKHQTNFICWSVICIHKM